MSDNDGFKQYALAMIQDGYLDLGEERACMMQASEYNLSGSDAQTILIELCQAHGAKLERLIRAEFEEKVTDAVDDLFLDNSELKALHQDGAEMFDGADDPMANAKKIIEMVIAKTGSYTEQQLLDAVRERLQPTVNQGHAVISKEDWDRIYTSEYSKVEALGVDCEENDIGEILDNALVSAGLEIGKVKKSGGGGFRKLMFLVVVVGGVMYGMGYFDDPAPSEGESRNRTRSVKTKAVTTPPTPVSTADDPSVRPANNCSLIASPGDRTRQLKSQIRKAIKLRCFRTPEKGCGGSTADALLGDMDSVCQPFVDATPRCQKQYEQAHGGWGHCTDPFIDKARNEMCAQYLEWAQKPTRKACGYIDRCLKVQPGNERAKNMKQTRRCP
jgi:hypothetical protein